MRKFFVYSRGVIETLPAFDYPHLFISIVTSQGEEAKLPKSPDTAGILCLTFEDKDVQMSSEDRLFSVSQAMEIWDFVLAHPKVDTILLHCDAGQCRSPAVAAAISKIFNGEDFEFFRRYRPNMRVYRTLLETWYREYDTNRWDHVTIRT